MEISNKTLAFLLVAAIAISLAGTVINMNRLGDLSVKRSTGFATSTGTANFTIQSSSSIRFATSTLDLGAGYVNSTGGYFNCTILSNHTNRVNKTSYACVNFTSLSVAPLVIENNGNVGLSVTLNVSNNATSFIGIGDASSGPASFQYQVYNNESGSCVPGVNLTHVNFTEVTGLNLMNDTWAALICSNLDYTDTSNSLVLGVQVRIPYTATGSDKRATFLVTGT